MLMSSGDTDRQTSVVLVAQQHTSQLQPCLVTPENSDVVERNFRVFAQPHNFCHGAQPSCNFGRFWAVLALIIFILGKFGSKLDL